MSINCAIIGAGAIGVGLENQDSSHAAAIKQNRDLRLVGIVDKNVLQLSRAATNYTCPGFSSVKDLMQNISPEIISVCVSDDAHAAILEELLIYKPKVVVVEKPVTHEPSSTLKIMAAYKAAGIPLLVNYSRRYLPIYHQIKDFCQIEGVVSATIRYGKGLKHNGCHAIDLAILLFGEPKSWKTLSTTIDFDQDDPTVSAHINFEYCPEFFLQSLDERCFTHFELDIFTKAKRYVIDKDHSRLRIYNAVSLKEGSTKRLIEEQEIKIEHGQALNNLMTNVVAVYFKRDKPVCDVENAYKSEHIAYSMSQEAKSCLHN